MTGLRLQHVLEENGTLFLLPLRVMTHKEEILILRSIDFLQYVKTQQF